MTSYTATRAAAAEIATSLVTLGSGALAMKQLTPGVATLATTLAGVLAQQAAIASFPLRAGLGGLWYGGRFPATPSLDALGAPERKIVCHVMGEDDRDEGR